MEFITSWLDAAKLSMDAALGTPIADEEDHFFISPAVAEEIAEVMTEVKSKFAEDGEFSLLKYTEHILTLGSDSLAKLTENVVPPPLVAALRQFKKYASGTFHHPSASFLSSILKDGPISPNTVLSTIEIVEVFLEDLSETNCWHLKAYIDRKRSADQDSPGPGIAAVIERAPMSTEVLADFTSKLRGAASELDTVCYNYTPVTGSDQPGFPARVLIGSGSTWALVLNLSIWKSQLSLTIRSTQTQVSPDTLAMVLEDIVFLQQEDKEDLEKALNLTLYYKTFSFAITKSTNLSAWLLLAGAPVDMMDSAVVSGCFFGTTSGIGYDPSTIWVQSGELKGSETHLIFRIPGNCLVIALGHLRLVYWAHLVAVSCLFCRYWADPDIFCLLLDTNQHHSQYFLTAFVATAINNCTVDVEMFKEFRESGQMNLALDSLQVPAAGTWSSQSEETLYSELSVLKELLNLRSPTVVYGGQRYLTECRFSSVNLYEAIVKTGFTAGLPVSLHRVSPGRAAELTFKRDNLGELAQDSRTAQLSPGPISHRSEKILSLDPAADDDMKIVNMEFGNLPRGRIAALHEWSRYNWPMVPILFRRLEGLSAGHDLQKWSPVLPILERTHRNMAPFSVLSSIQLVPVKSTVPEVRSIMKATRDFSDRGRRSGSVDRRQVIGRQSYERSRSRSRFDSREVDDGQQVERGTGHGVRGSRGGHQARGMVHGLPGKMVTFQYPGSGTSRCGRQSRRDEFEGQTGHHGPGVAQQGRVGGRGGVVRDPVRQASFVYQSSQSRRQVAMQSGHHEMDVSREEDSGL